MHELPRKRRPWMIATVSIVLTLSAVISGASADKTGDLPRYAKDCKLERPDYRQWVFLSSGLGMNYGPSASGASGPPAFTNVYVNPASYAAFLHTGQWPDKTMFALEIYSSASISAPNRTGSFQDKLRGLEFNVKDSAFPEGWRFFSFDEDARVGTPIPKDASCMACHTKHAAVENSFGQFYPTIKTVAMEKGTYREVQFPPEQPAHK